MRPLWTAENAKAATGGNGAGGWQADGVSIDSRSVKPGDLFVALKGPSHDGHDHVADALAKGAAAAMVQRDPPGVAAEAALLRVADCQAGLEALGQAGRKRFRGRVIALTGSVGKTGTKDMLRHVLSAQAATAATEGNLNNHIGAPLTLARLPEDAAYGVVELGMNHAEEIRPLSRMTRPHVALITRIAAAHTEFFDSLDGVAAAKAEIFDGVEPDGVAVINADDGFTEKLRHAARSADVATVLTFGESADADARLLNLELGAEGSAVTASIHGEPLAYRLGAPGKHWVANSLGATERLDLPQGPVTLIDESYNASPAAMQAAFAVLAGRTPPASGRRVAVLGDMLELGAGSKAAHAALGEALAALPVAAVFGIGPEMAAAMQRLRADQQAGYAATSAEMAIEIVPALKAGDVVLIKGSLGIGMARIVRALRDAASGRGNADAV